MEANKRIYIVHEETNINGDIECSIIAASFDKETAKEAMKKHFETYNDKSHIFDFTDEDLVFETNDDNMYVKDLVSDYYAFLSVLSKEII